MFEVAEVGKKPKKNSKNYSKLAKFYLLPISSVFIFIGVIGLLVFPKISDLLSEVEKISVLNNEISENNVELRKLNSLQQDFTAISSKLSVINQIAPLGNTEVVKFRGRVFDLSAQNSLRIVSERYTEVVESQSNNNQDSIGVVGLQEVPSSFEITGSYQNILNFIEQLENLEDFVVVSEMRLQLRDDLRNAAFGNWSLEIELTKYQFRDREESDLRDSYLNVPSDANLNQFMQKYLDDRIN